MPAAGPQISLPSIDLFWAKLISKGSLYISNKVNSLGNTRQKLFSGAYQLL